MWADVGVFRCIIGEIVCVICLKIYRNRWDYNLKSDNCSMRASTRVEVNTSVKLALKAVAVASKVKY